MKMVIAGVIGRLKKSPRLGPVEMKLLSNKSFIP